ncbi:ABC-2 type transport system ATP-binding protein [Sporomusaceae bacterium BoRhaA]|uniref:ABC transporter ATP-binding protein n=1 Tax=Pelorhabdus rhamnosifermentans TaxID=2772457 RepID=UPI001C063185|nr:ABC transporter ATP-binding protein [Pelorhabdus rhamnosifermentans]MBU2703594.1 ABC-2 type transport system ATP-binding protein [Pelorhabdus rhamnosifermentans]
MVVVETKNLTCTFGSFTAVNRLSIRIEQGSIYGFLGPNGSGKSTTIRMLCGLITPTSGSGIILGYDVTKEAEQIKAKIGYMSQKFSLYDDLTVRENLNFYAGMYDLTGNDRKERINEMMAMAGLTERAHELAANLSGGWKQRLALGCAVIHHPAILFLDEPTGGVDPKSRRMFWDIIYQLATDGTTVMVTTHFMDEAEHCDHIGFIYEGNLIANDGPEALKRQLPGVLLEIDAADPIGLMEKIKHQDQTYLDVYPYGNHVHVLVGKEQTHAFDSLQPRCISPSLEDVFVYYVKDQRRKVCL